MKENNINKTNYEHDETILELMDQTHQADTKAELEMQKAIRQSNVVGIVLLIAAFIIPVFAWGAVSWMVEGTFELPRKSSDFTFCFVTTCIIASLASVFFILSGITKSLLKQYKKSEGQLL